MIVYTWENAQEVAEFIGEANLAECEICDGSGEYDDEYGVHGCPECNSRLIPFFDGNGVRQTLDWGDTVHDGYGGLYYIEGKEE